MVRMFSSDQSQRPTAQEMVNLFRNWVRAKTQPTPTPTAVQGKVLIMSHPSGRRLRIWKDGVVTKYKMRPLGNVDDLSTNVFEAKRQQGVWMIKGLPPEPGKQSVLYNGVDITNKWVPLAKGAKVKIGPHELTVTFEG